MRVFYATLCLILLAFTFAPLAQAQFLDFDYDNDGKRVTFGTMVIPADPKTFKVIIMSPTTCNDYCGGSYAYDKDHVFFEGTLLEGSSSKDFFLFGDATYTGYSKDKAHAWWLDKPIKGADITSFVVDGKDFAHDKNHGYYREHALPIAEYKSSPPITIFGSDAFALERKVDGADAQTFEVVKEHYFRDKNYVYLDEQRLSQFDSASFRVINNKFLSDKNGIYSAYLNSPSEHDFPNFTLLAALAGHAVRTIDKKAEPALFTMCNLLSHGYGQTDPECCSCVRDDTTLFAFTNNGPKKTQILVSAPIDSIQTDTDGFTYNGKYYRIAR